MMLLAGNDTDDFSVAWPWHAPYWVLSSYFSP